MKKSKYYLIPLILFFSILLSISKSNANEISEFLTLKNDKVNLRQGPSFEYPIKLIYKKKYLPVIILDKSETWRKIKDFENNSGWIHISQLSKKKSAINIKNNSNPDGDIEIVYKGLNPGEKLNEELIINAKAQKTSHPLIYKAVEQSSDYNLLEEKLYQLNLNLDKNNINESIKILNEIVPEWLRK